MRPRPLVLIGALFISTTAARAHASERELRRGTLLVAGRPEAPPVLYVAAGTVTRVRFVGLLAPRALPGPELQGHVEVAPLGEGSLVISIERDLAEGERLVLPVTGRTETGESLTLTLALVTRKDAVDAEAWVSRASVLPEQVAPGDEVSAVARSLLASHGPGATPPRLALDIPRREQATTWTRDLQASAGSVLQMDGHLFVTVRIRPRWFKARPWRLIRARLEAGCRQESTASAESQPLRVTSEVSAQYQLHSFTAPLQEGAGCLSLTLEEDGPRTLRFEQLGLSP